MILKRLKKLFGGQEESRSDTKNGKDDLKYLIVGLGNIGEEYAGTRHNIGFEVVDAFAEASGAVFTPSRYGAVANVKFKGRTLVLLKPSTFMNLSGKAVSYWLKQEKLGIDKLFVIVDDIALPFGTVRIRAKGSDGGHNGLKDINQVLGSNGYARLRFGIGGDFPKGYQVDHVLGEWTSEEKKDLPVKIEAAIEAIKSFATIGLERTMNFHNKK